MNKTSMEAMTSKWALVVKEYELVKAKKSKVFTKVDDICKTFKVHRKDISKYYERWVKSGKRRESLLQHKRGPKPGQSKRKNV